MKYPKHSEKVVTDVKRARDKTYQPPPPYRAHSTSTIAKKSARTLMPKKLIITSFLALLVISARPEAGEYETTWRAGDVAPVSTACESLGSAKAEAIAISRRDGSSTAFGDNFFDRFDAEAPNTASCFTAPAEAKGVYIWGGVRLVAWAAGHYQWARATVSVWEAVSPTGERLWVLLPDDLGPHDPLPAVRFDP